MGELVGDRKTSGRPWETERLVGELVGDRETSGRPGDREAHEPPTAHHHSTVRTAPRPHTYPQPTPHGSRSVHSPHCTAPTLLTAHTPTHSPHATAHTLTQSPHTAAHPPTPTHSQARHHSTVRGSTARTPAHSPRTLVHLVW